MKVDWEKALRSKTLLIFGEEDALRRKALAELCARAELGPDDFNLETFTAGDGRSPKDWLASVSTAPFLGDRRTVVVRHLLRVDTPKEAGLASGALAGLPESARLVLVGDDEGGDDRRRERMARIAAAWEKFVTDEKGLVIRCTVDPKQTAALLVAEAKLYGKPLSAGAATLLAEYVGGSYSRGMEELEKLAFFVGEKESIREADVRQVVTPSREWNVFSMIDAAVAGNTGAALRQLHLLLEGTGRPDEAIPQRILPLLSRQFRLIWQARLCVEEGTNPTNAPESVRALFPSRPNLAKETYAQGRAMTAARRLSLDQIRLCMQALADADARMKGALTGFKATETLERLLLQIVDTVQPRAA